jgi:hypothetical protein
LTLADRAQPATLPPQKFFADRRQRVGFGRVLNDALFSFLRCWIDTALGLAQRLSGKLASGHQ